MHFLRHLNQLFVQVHVVQGCIWAKRGRFWFGTGGQKDNFLRHFLGVPIRAGKELCDTHASKTFTRAAHRESNTHVIFSKSLFILSAFQSTDWSSW